MGHEQAASPLNTLRTTLPVFPPSVPVNKHLCLPNGKAKLSNVLCVCPGNKDTGWCSGISEIGEMGRARFVCSVPWIWESRKGSIMIRGKNKKIEEVEMTLPLLSKEPECLLSF